MSASPNGYSGGYELEFERPLVQLEKQIAKLASHAGEAGVDFAAELCTLREKHTAMLRKTYASLPPWHIVRVARHPGRPQGLDYIRAFVKEYCELHGDRCFGDDRAIVTGLGRIGPHKCLIIAHNKGKDTRDRIACNFGMAHPEGYRKALRTMKMAEKFGLPVVTMIDTPGAYPGIGAEERGQAEAIAMNLREMSRLRVPLVSAIIGEGGSGGALGIGVADRVAMLQFAWYSVISPEGCASILWKTGEQAEAAAAALKLTAADNQRLGIVDEVLEEPLGAAHRDPGAAAERLEKWLIRTIRELSRYKTENLIHKRMARLRRMGECEGD